MKYLLKNTVASNPGKIKLSKEKLKVLRPDLFGLKGFLNVLKSFFSIDINYKKYIKECLLFGDTQPAIVVSINPHLLIAAYSDDLDCVILLKFPNEFIEKYALKEKSKLISINTYRKGDIPNDITLGEKHTNLWTNFSPLIADFISNNLDKIEEKKKNIDEDNWSYIYSLGIAYQNQNIGIWRDGRPVFSSIPAK